MPENTDMSAPIKLAEGYNPFGDEGVAPQAQPAVEVAPTAPSEPNVPQESAQAPQEEAKPQEQQSLSTFDPNQFVKERFGYESVEEAEQEFKKLKEKPADFEFKDNISKTLFDAIKEGNADDVYEVLNQQKKLERLTKGELDINLAGEIVKASIRSKNSDLTDDDVDLLYYDKFYVPQKPVQGFEESDEDFAAKTQQWEATADYVQRKLIIEAKLIRPELEKLKSEIRLPDIYTGLMYFRYSQEAYTFFEIAAACFKHWDSIVPQLKKYSEHQPTTDLVYAIVCQHLGIENYTLPGCDFINFTHMKNSINQWPEATPWSKLVISDVDAPMIRINGINQYHPFHYQDKEWLTDDIIRKFEQAWLKN